MTPKTKNIVRLAIGWYLLVGGIASLIAFVVLLGIPDLFIFLLPAFICFLFTTFSAISGYYLLKSANNLTIDCAVIALLLQAIHFTIFGFDFINSFGVEFGAGFSDTPEFHFLGRARFLIYGFKNGLAKSSNENRLFINLFQVVLVVLLVKSKPLKSAALAR